MRKFYEKNEILTAILWIVLYVVTAGNLRSLGDDSPYMMIGLLVISSLLLLFVLKLGLREKYGLSAWAKNSRALLWLIPLWIIASSNLWGGVSPNYAVPGLIFAIVSMALVGFAEELIFRGFLFRAMLKDGKPAAAIIVSSLTFGLGHIVNLLTGHELGETLLQVVFAVAVGFVFTMVFYRGGSLLPCILAHSLIDVFSLFAAEDSPALFNWIAHGVVIALSVGYGLYLLKYAETPRPGAQGKSA